MARNRLSSAFHQSAVRASLALTFVASLGIAGGACSSDDEALAPGSSGGAGGTTTDGGSNGKGGAAPDASGSGGAAGATGGAAGAGAGGASGTGGAGGGAAGATGKGGTAGNGGSTGGTGGATGGSGGTGGTGGGAGSSGGAGSGGSSIGPDAAIDVAGDVGKSDGSGPDGVTPDAPSSDGNVRRPPCMKNANQVIVLGDSYVNWISHTFPRDLATEAGVTYRMYAVGGTAMGSGGIGLIPPQLDQAVAANPDIIAAVMDGGGNDILVADTAQFPQGAQCKQSMSSPTIPDCQKIVQKAVDAAITLMNSAADKGVKDVVYFFYPHVPEGTLVGGAYPNQILDYALPLVKATCDGANARTGGRLTCHFLDLIPVFNGHPEYFAPADIHPNATGSKAMAQAVWKTMKDQCIAQPASSGCCTP